MKLLKLGLFGFVISMFFIFSSLVFASDPVVIHDDWTSFTNGNEINDIEIEGDYIWCATSGGIVRWNRKDRTNVKYATEHGLISNDVRSVAIDLDNVKWFGTWGGGVMSYDGTTWRTYTTDDGLSSNLINLIEVDNENVKWFGTWLPNFRNGISSFDGTTWRKYNVKDGMASGTVTSIVVDKDNVKWFGYGFGSVDSYDGTTWKTYTQADGVLGDINAIAVDVNNVKWFGYYGKGLSSFDGITWNTYTKEDVLPSNTILAISVDLNNVKWFVTFFEIISFDGKTWTIYNNIEGLNTRSFHAIAIDNDNVKWIGTPNGLMSFDGTTWNTYTTEDVLSSNIINAIAVDANNVKWFSTYHYDDRTYRSICSFDGIIWQTYPELNQQLYRNIQAIAVDADNIKWVGTGGEGVFSFDDTTWRNYTTKDGLTGNDNVQAIAVDTDNIKWFGTYSGGVSSFDGTTWQTYTTENGLSGNYINAIAIDKNNVIWFGTNEGVSSFDGTIWKTYTMEDGLVNNHVNVIGVDLENVIWFGTNEGVSSFDGTIWKAYTTEDGLIINLVNTIAIDKYNTKWFGTYSGGVSSFDGTTWQTYTTADGLAEDHVNAIGVDLENVIWFGTQYGVSRFVSEPSFYLVLTSPNGGEEWISGKSKNITWTSIGVSNVKLEYTTDNGTNWNEITTEVDALTGSYDWFVPEVESTECLIKITDAADTTLHDVSDGTFTIEQKPSIELTMPNGGEIWRPDSTYVIKWLYVNVDSIKIEYTHDGGATWNKIIESVDALDVTYSWTIPNIESNDCLVRITSIYDESIIDESDEVFAIEPVLPSPSSFEPDNITDNGVTIKWADTTEDELGFSIERKEANTVYTEIARTNPNSTEYTVINLKPETSYSFRIRAYNEEGFSPSTDEITITTLPAVLTLSPYKSLNLNVGDFVEYRATGGSGSYTWISSNADVATIDAAGILTANAAGAMAVILKDSEGNATTSAMIRVTTGVPAAPTNLTAEPLSSSAALLQWADNADDEASYRIEYKEQGGTYEELFVLGANMTTFEAGGFQSETTYTFRVFASNGFGDSGSSNEISITTPAATIFVAPDSSLSLSPISIDPDGWQLYEVSGGTSPYSWSTTNKRGSIDEGGIFTALADGPVMVKVEDNEGNAEFSKPILIDSQLPYPPGTLKAKAISTTYVELTWEDNSDNEVGFILESKAGGDDFAELFSLGKNVESHLEMNLQEKTTYTFRLKSYNRNGSSKYSNQISSRTSSTITLKRQIAGGNYNLFAVPCYPDNGDPLVVLDELGAYDNTKWRLGHWSGNKYQECPSIDSFEPGKGFWFITKNNIEISVSGRSTDPSGVHEITLKSGWNQIGNPFEITVDWSLAEIEKYDLVYSISNEKATGVENRLVGYSGGGYSNKTQLEPWQGYWVYNANQIPVTLRLSAVKQSAKTAAKMAYNDDIVWSMNVKVSNGKYADTDNVVGVRKSATDEWDSYDWREPPLPFEGVSMYFVNDQHSKDKRSCDYRSPGKEWSWLFNVEATSPDETYSVGFEMNDEVMNEYSIMLRNVITGDVYSVTEDFSLPVAIGESVRTFELIVAEKDGNMDDQLSGIPDSFTVGQPFPNPFNTGTTISYSLPHSGDVRISVYNVLGQIVFDQTFTNLSPGNKFFTWNGKKSNGNPVNSGVYFINISSERNTKVKKVVYIK